MPSLIHFADYLQGGFDKQYPDHLPPSPGFGTPEEFRAFAQRSRQLGHLTMPYTNPTWWCDIGLRIAFGETDSAPERLAVTSIGKEWLGPDLSAALATRSGIANRGLVTGPDAPETLSLVTSANPSEPATYIGAQRLGGVGLLWRIGGFNPDPAVSLPTVAQVINHLYTKPPVPSGKAAARRLYHATITSP